MANIESATVGTWVQRILGNLKGSGVKTIRTPACDLGPEFLSFYHNSLCRWTGSATIVGYLQSTTFATNFAVFRCRGMNVLIISHDCLDASSAHTVSVGRWTQTYRFPGQYFYFIHPLVFQHSSSLSICLGPQTKHKYPCRVRGRSTSLVCSIPPAVTTTTVNTTFPSLLVPMSLRFRMPGQGYIPYSTLPKMATETCGDSIGRLVPYPGTGLHDLHRF